MRGFHSRAQGGETTEKTQNLKEKLEKEKEPEKAKGKKKVEPKPETKPEQPLFPAEGKINKYGFIYLPGEILAAFGVTKGAEHALTINLEGDKLIIRKA